VSTIPHILLSILFLIGGTPTLAAADLLTPLASGNRAPLASIYGLPTRPNDVAGEPGQWRFTLDNSLASNHLDVQTANHALLLDGESWRTEMRFTYSYSQHITVASTLPFIVHSGGFLDSFIIDWHKTFGLPQGGRDTAPRNRILYRYSEDGHNQVLLDKSARGIGDLQLEASWKPPSGGTFRYHLLLKLPTGDPDRLLGSGATDLSLWLERLACFDTSSGRFSLSASFGASWLGHGKVLPSRQRRTVLCARLNSGWQPYPWLAAQLCLEGHSALYRGTGLQELDDPALTLTGGFSLRPAGKWIVELALSEDLAVGGSPDVVFQLNLHRSF